MRYYQLLFAKKRVCRVSHQRAFFNGPGRQCPALRRDPSIVYGGRDQDRIVFICSEVKPTCYTMVF